MKRQMGERDIRRIEAGLKNLEVREGLTVKANILLEKITKKLKVDNDIAEEVFSKMIGRVEEELDGTGEKLSTDQLLDSLAWVIDNIDISHFRTEVEEEKRSACTHITHDPLSLSSFHQQQYILCTYLN